MAKSYVLGCSSLYKENILIFIHYTQNFVHAKYLCVNDYLVILVNDDRVRFQTLSVADFQRAGFDGDLGEVVHVFFPALKQELRNFFSRKSYKEWPLGIQSVISRLAV